jgi:hypothetical protein
MTRVVLDQAVLAKLLESQQPVEICDIDGRILGRFHPAWSRNSSTPHVPSTSEQEVRRIEQEPGGRTLAEILADLEKRG